MDPLFLLSLFFSIFQLCQTSGAVSYSFLLFFIFVLNYSFILFSFYLTIPHLNPHLTTLFYIPKLLMHPYKSHPQLRQLAWLKVFCIQVRNRAKPGSLLMNGKVNGLVQRNGLFRIKFWDQLISFLFGRPFRLIIDLFKNRLWFFPNWLFYNFGETNRGCSRLYTSPTRLDLTYSWLNATYWVIHYLSSSFWFRLQLS